jgi:peptidylprolyl isomerase
MSLKKGDFALINYTSRIKESNETIDTTLETVAKEAKIHRSENIYEPQFVVVGEGWVPKGLDEALTNLEVGKDLTVEVPPEKGYGVRDPSKMKLVPIRRFNKEKTTPVPGSRIEIDGRSALVRSVGAGRVQVDFNHPLAGKTLVYNLKLEKTLESTEEKIKALIHRRMPTPVPEKFNLTLSENECKVEIPDEAFLIEGLQVAKRVISNDIQKLMPEIARVVFVEVFKKPSTVAEAKPKEAAPSVDTAAAPQP